MKVSKSKIEKLIQESIREIYGLEDELLRESPAIEHHGAKRSEVINKAKVCCNMASVDLFDMCGQICRANAEQYAVCARLCVCASNNDMPGCCECIDLICKCHKCHNICTQCCGC